MIGAGISYSSLSAPERSALCRKAGRCEICGSATRTLALDHDHNTDQVRGVLCFVCNLALVYHIERGTIPKVPEELVLVAFAYLDATSWQSVMALPNGTVRVIR